MGGPLGSIGRPPLLLTNILSNTSMINKTNDDNGDGDSDIDNDSDNGSDPDYYEFHTQEIYEDHKVEELTSEHTKTLYMLETVKIYLLSGYLRTEGITKIFYIPEGILNVVLLFYDDSFMNFHIKINDLFAELDGIRNPLDKLQGREFKFHLNMD